MPLALSRPLPVTRRAGASVTVRAAAGSDATAPIVSRRSAALAAAAALLAATTPRPAAAFLGLGGPSRDEAYAQDTSAVIAAVRAAVTLEPGTPERVAAVAAIRTATNSWVAKYRRDNSFSGKPSYGNTYSALNAVAGHINSFGPETSLPKKRLERVMKELDDADKLIGRGR